VGVWFDLKKEFDFKSIRDHQCEGDEERLKTFDKFIEINGFDKVSTSYDYDWKLKQILTSGRYSYCWPNYSVGRCYLPSKIELHGGRIFRKTHTKKICLVLHGYWSPMQEIKKVMEEWANYYGLNVNVYDDKYSWLFNEPTALIIVTASDDVDIKVM